MSVCQIRMSSYRRSTILRLLFGVFIVMLILVALSDYNIQHRLKRKMIKTRTRSSSPVDCASLIKGDEAEQRRADEYQKDHPKKATSNVEYINMTRNCDKFVKTRGYITSSSSEEEKNFPLAFSILVFKDVEQFERLLRAVYRPQNVYCVHVDKKAESTLHEAVNDIARCFSNVLVLQNNVDVTWGTYSVLEPDILCMEALLKYRKWKYFINLTGQEFPLKTNWELVQILKALKGTNIVQATIRFGNPERLAGKPPPPIHVTPIKGSVHIVVRREFVDYAINNENAQKLLNWSKLIPHASEIFFSTLNHNPQLGIPGTYLGEPETNRKKYPLINRYKVSDYDFILLLFKHLTFRLISGLTAH